MRRVLSWSLALALWSAPAILAAEPIVRGHLLTPGKTLAGGINAPTILVHVVNPDRQAVPAEKLRIGVSFSSPGGRTQAYEVAAGRPLPGPGIATWRIKVPAGYVGQVGARGPGGFTAYARRGEDRWVGDARDWRNQLLTGAETTETRVTELYTEAPALGDPAAIVPPPEIPFEHEVVAPLRPGRPGSGVAPVAAPSPRPPHVPARPAMAQVVTAGSGVGSRPGPSPKPAKPALGSAALIAVGPGRVAAKPARTPPATAVGATGRLPAASPKVSGVAAGSATGMAPEAVAKAPAAPGPTDRNPRDFKTIRTIDEELVIYVIKPGDTLATIASRYYGAADKEKLIAEVNFIEKASAVKVGEEIIVEVRPLPSDKASSKDSGRGGRKGSTRGGKQARHPLAAQAKSAVG